MTTIHPAGHQLSPVTAQVAASPPRPIRGSDPLTARRLRVRTIRRRVVAIATAIFLATTGGIFIQLVSGNDPALARSETTASAASTVKSSSSGTASTSSAATSGAGSSSSDSSSGGSSSTSGGAGTTSSVTPVTTSAS